MRQFGCVTKTTDEEAEVLEAVPEAPSVEEEEEQAGVWNVSE